MQAASSDSSVRRWTTETVAEGQRLDYWVGAICEAFLEMGCSSRVARLFDGELTSVPLADVVFNQVISSTQDVYRTPAAIARGASHPYYLIAQWQHPWQVRQGGRLVQLRPGDAVLVDSAQRYELHFPEAVGCLSVQIPRVWAGRWLSQPEGVQPRIAARDQNWGRVLSALCLQLGQHPLLARSYPEALLSDHLGALLSAALEPSLATDIPASGRPALLARARDLMRQRLDEIGLTAESVAIALGVSIRTLHRCFAAADVSFAGTLRRLRLDQARAWLAQPRWARVGVGEIGRRCGFADASHFTREFQQAFGQTPARWRRGVL
ncbi:helix-turn-helix domain-containing protein [Hylemonella gracilis]|uniref:Helix-turn-helix domain-containing protein n=1 Tax=Hylemonella gracilis TaxID=80880 RepID=A0A4P6UNH9_9BURK|nr:helix-turn-helix domain-containing protein [Hylemonella gracilis]QBK05151.1 helix-turn-helix domain-containing protein [Hylemonella gracilis]